MQNPLAEQPAFMDDLAKQLDAVETSIENSSPISAPDAVEDNDADDILSQADELSDPEHIQQVDKEEDEPEPAALVSDPIQPKPLANQSSKGAPLSKPTGDKRFFQGLKSPGRTVAHGRTKASGSSGMRICPGSHELIDTEKCNDCDKYRHWPQGTNEEPKECWYDWQNRQTDDDSDEDIDE